MAQELNPNILLIAGLGVAAYLVWQSYQKDKPKGGSDGSVGGVAGAAGDLVAGPAPVVGVGDVEPLDQGLVHPLEVQIVLDSPAEGGDVAHTPLRNTFPLRLYVDNYTEHEVSDRVLVSAVSDAIHLPTGTEEFSTEFGPVKVPPFGRRYLQIPVNFGSDFSIGPFGWYVAVTVNFGGASAQRSFTVH